MKNKTKKPAAAGKLKKVIINGYILLDDGIPSGMSFNRDFYVSVCSSRFQIHECEITYTLPAKPSPRGSRGGR